VTFMDLFTKTKKCVVVYEDYRLLGRETASPCTYSQIFYRKVGKYLKNVCCILSQKIAVLMECSSMHVCLGLRQHAS
jgi:hypothetical protein